ncbi:MAG: hypothetical protein ACOX7E_08730 [Paludibacter sp.]
MVKEFIIKTIISIPKKLYTERNKSIYDLLKESGYFDCYESIDTKDIFNVLTQIPDNIEYWFRLSEDKRVDSGYFIEKLEHDKYIVGYHQAHIVSNLLEYDDINEACASFISKEIEEIRISFVPH